MPAADVPSVSLSFANNFWGKDDAGVHPLIERMTNAKLTCDELKGFYNSRATIEEEYSRKLLALCRKPLGSQETGSLRSSMDVVRGEVEQMAKSHQTIAAQMRTELEEPLAAFAGSMKERRKIVQNGVEKLLKTKVQQTNQVNKTRDRYEQECLKIKGYLAQGHMVMGQEERKNKAKLEKTQINLATSNAEYESAVKVLEETTGRWNRDWKAAADKFQDLEEERLDFTKSSLWSFANIASTVCVSDDGSCEKIRISLENCEVEKDIMGFIKDRGTGQEIPDPPKYINFCRGDINDTQSESSEDDNYSVAQFPRTINPSYRTSSPQPSTYESHHDPNSSLAQDFGHGEPDPSAGRKNSLTPQVTPKAPKTFSENPRQNQIEPQQQVGRPPYGQSQSHQPQRHQLYDQPPPQQIEKQPTRHQLYDQPVQPIQQQRQAQFGSQPRQNRLQYDQAQHGPVSTVPHDPYPMDGMTMLCRTAGPASERSSAPSPNRPSSRDSQSDYSNPTSFSSQDPLSRKQSPVKQEVILSPTPERTIQKKKSTGFFQAKSPFRRKSRSEKDNPLKSAESHRNTWSSSNQNTPTHRRQTYSQDHQSKSLITDRETNSPEEIDPRAKYQLNVGNNVFDVAGPDRRGKPAEPAAPEQEELDPIAQALAELRDVNKVSSSRMSADHYHGIATPAPGASRPTGPPMMSGALVSGMRGTPPPSYDQPPVQRLGLPQPAFTSKAMQQSTQKYVAQKQDMFSTPTRPPPQQHRSSFSQPQSRPAIRENNVPRATSPLPPRGTSPRPIVQERRQPSPQPIVQDQRHASPRPIAQPERRQTSTASPNAYSASPRSPSQYNTPRTPQSATPQQRGSAMGYYRQNSPGMNSPVDAQSHRAVSPLPFRESQSRPGSSHVGNDMSIQLAPDNDGYASGSQYGGSQRGGGNNMRPSTANGGNARPLSYYNPPEGQLQMAPSTRQRSKSVVDGRQFTREGRPILHFARAMYMYTAAIPEELSFAKGDTLAVLRLQDDGWWEAEVAGKVGRPGLVPSNYLQKI